MALKLKNLETPYGISISDVYFHIRFVSYDDINKRICFNGAFYVGEEAYRAGVQPMAGMFLDDWFASEKKDGNLFEESYNYIKENAKNFMGKTIEEIEAHNNSMMTEGDEGEMLNPLYCYFIDAKDC
jgi:hypothetical protein